MRPPNRFAEGLLRRLCREVSGRNRAVVRRPIVLLRRIAIRLGDPTVRFELDGSLLVIPLSHDLPVHRAHNPAYSRNLGIVAAAVDAERPGATLVDIGANVGDSVAIVRARSQMPILCVEGDSMFLPFLVENVAGQPEVEVAATYVATSHVSGPVELTVRRSRGTARLEEGTGGGSNAVAVRTLETILAEHPVFDPPSVVKIDTDGNDGAILQSAIAFLAKCLPVIFYEHDPQLASAVGAVDPAEVAAELARVGYTTFLVFTNSGQLLARRTASEVVSDPRCLFPSSSQDLPYVDVCALVDRDAAIADRIVEQVTPQGLIS